MNEDNNHEKSTWKLFVLWHKFVISHRQEATVTFLSNIFLWASKVPLD